MENTNIPLCNVVEPVRVFTFKPERTSDNKDEFITVTAKSLDEAVESNPQTWKMYLHSITK